MPQRPVQEAVHLVDVGGEPQEQAGMEEEAQGRPIPLVVAQELALVLLQVVALGSREKMGEAGVGVS